MAAYGCLGFFAPRAQFLLNDVGFMLNRFAQISSF
jgi:hypothetical protein